jgi:hypothetical protein
LTPKPKRTKTSIGLDPALWRRVKIASAVSGKEMYDIVAAALERELTRAEYKVPQEVSR